MNTDGIDITKSQSNAREHNLMLQGRSKFFFYLQREMERGKKRQKEEENGRGRGSKREKKKGKEPGRVRTLALVSLIGTSLRLSCSSVLGFPEIRERHLRDDFPFP